jgi:hypothetical protein
VSGARDYAAEHRRRNLLTPADRRRAAQKRAERNARLIAEGRIAWSSGNEKLRKLGTISFGIPAGVASDGFNTCRQSLALRVLNEAA